MNTLSAILAVVGVVLAIAAFVVVIRRAAKRAERTSKERAARKWGKAYEEGKQPDTRKPWDGSKSGES